MSALFLTDEELQELTECARKRQQIEWLQARRYPFEVGAKGSPRVLRAVVMDRLGPKVATVPKRPQVRMP